MSRSLARMQRHNLVDLKVLIVGKSSAQTPWRRPSSSGALCPNFAPIKLGITPRFAERRPSPHQGITDGHGRQVIYICQGCPYYPRAHDQGEVHLSQHNIVPSVLRFLQDALHRLTSPSLPPSLTCSAGCSPQGHCSPSSVVFGSSRKVHLSSRHRVGALPECAIACPSHLHLALSLSFPTCLNSFPPSVLRPLAYSLFPSHELPPSYLPTSILSFRCQTTPL